ncbi:hypothetical protein JCM19275_789 [Nonlabens ulvanivorans]|uniref:Uncharacterized protein n=1 Tax=Nonlabens ulvanivorans TaxID=906888 RepID=A0A090WH54_NONUL|nr:hypothetical protein JCM19275_789 [Nonlabens ulvanivorans]
MNRAQLKEYLDAKVEQYNVPDFIHTILFKYHIFLQVKKTLKLQVF